MNLKQATTRLCVIGIIVGGAAWFTSAHRPVHYAAGMLITQEPVQMDFKTPQPVIEKNGWKLTPLALYTIEARVLGKEHYDGDPVAGLAPWDLALGWGRMSDESILERLDITQSYRFYHWTCWGAMPITEREITTHSSNNHIIPANPSVSQKISSLRVGALVRITGTLVEATHPQASQPWRSSLTRTDTGDGACEIIYATSITELPHP